MVYVLTLLSGLLITLARPRSKYFMFITTMVVCGVIIYLMGTVSPMHSFDTAAYEYMYNLSPATHRFEQGYMWLSYFFYVHGWLFEQFRIFCSAIFVLVLYVGVKRFTDNTIMFFTLFLIFPFFVEATTVRNFYMFALVVLGTSMLKEGKIWRNVLASLIIACGSLFQVSGIVYLVVPLLFLLSPKALIRLGDYSIVILSSAVIVVHYFFPTTFVANLVQIIAELSGRSNVSEMANLYSQGSSFTKVIWYLIAFVVFYILLRFSLLSLNGAQSLRYKGVFCLVLVGIMVIPALAGSVDFERFLNNGICAGYVVFCQVYFTKYRDIVDRLKVVPIFLILVVCFTFAWRYWDSSPSGRLQYLPYIAQLRKD